MSFIYHGPVPASKSMLNRALIVQSFAPSLKLMGDSRCDDVRAMREALPAILGARGEPADCGAAGTTFRFLALRAARLPGRHRLVGSAQLLTRPHDELIDILGQLGCRAQLDPTGLTIEGDGWQSPARPLAVDRARSSQFASAVLLSAWDLPFDLELALSGGGLSEGYWTLTKELVKAAGMPWSEERAVLRVPAKTRVRAENLRCEMDLSSAFALAALAAVDGEVALTDFPRASQQPDFRFPEILRTMGCAVARDGDTLCVGRVASLRGIDLNLSDCPDLFPVLAVLCSLASGPSRLWGAPQLAHKESSRITQIALLLRGLGARFTARKDGMEFAGGLAVTAAPAMVFDPCHDHRLAMAAAVAKRAGARVRVLTPEVVNKSFPEFWDIAR